MINAIIADDNKDLCMLLANELNTTKDIKVIEMLSDGSHVIQEIKRLHPQIIILDLKMPGKNGLQIIEEIENDDEIKTKVIVLSGESDYVAKLRDFRCMISYIRKGADFKEISMKIKEISHLMDKKSINQLILDYLLDLGFSTTNSGTDLMKDCIRIFLLKRKKDIKIKELIKMVSKINIIESYKVKNNIHNSTKAAWNTGDQKHIIEKLKLGATEPLSPKKVITMSSYYIDID